VRGTQAEEGYDQVVVVDHESECGVSSSSGEEKKTGSALNSPSTPRRRSILVRDRIRADRRILDC